MVAIEAQCSGLPTIVSDVLPKEVEITKCLKKIGLNESANEWANQIIYFCDGYNRTDTSIYVKRAGYDINDIVKKLERLYKG